MPKESKSAIENACDADLYSVHAKHIGEQTDRSLFDIEPWGTIVEKQSASLSRV